MSDATLGAWLGRLEEWRNRTWLDEGIDPSYSIARDLRGWRVQARTGPPGDRLLYAGKGATLRAAVTQLLKNHKMGWNYVAMDKRLAAEAAERDEQ